MLLTVHHPFSCFFDRVHCNYLSVEANVCHKFVSVCLNLRGAGEEEVKQTPDLIVEDKRSQDEGSLMNNWSVKDDS